MVRRQDRKVWNEELARACDCRYEMASRNGSRDQFKWQEGAKAIRAVRKDMVEKPVSSGVTNLPTNKLKKTVLELLLNVIAGREPVEPEGYAAAMQRPQQGNPFEHDSYLKSIKARGGAYAILMAFHHSAINTLSIDEICTSAQPYCDTEMEANYMAARNFGAWKSNETLLKRGLISRTAGGARYHEGVGFRGQKSYFTLTRDGEMFTEAMIQKFHQGVAPTQQSSASPHSPVRTTGIKSSPFHTPTRGVGRPALAAPNRSKELSKGDEGKLRSWAATAQLSDTIDFKVGKARRKKLHDACDDLEREIPGLKLAHDSTNVTDTSNRRVLTVRMIQRPHDSQQVTGSAKRRLFAVARTPAGSFSSSSAAKRQKSGLPPSVAAAQAAFERHVMHETSDRNPIASIDDDNDFDNKMKLAIKLSQEAASKPPPSMKPEEFDCRPAAMEDHGSDSDELKRVLEVSQKTASQYPALQDLEEMERRAIEESIKMARQSAAAAAAAAAWSPESDTSDSDDDLLDYAPFGDRKQAAKKSLAQKKDPTSKRSLFPRQSNNEPIDLLLDDEATPESRTAATFLVTEGTSNSTRRVPVATMRQEVIDIDENSENDGEIIEVEDSRDIIVLDDSQDSISPVGVAASSRKPATSGSTPPQLYILIDNRERNRNCTPRHLRMELTKLVKEGALKCVWPRNMPIGSVEERGLALGDFGFDIECDSSMGRKCIPICIERKRVSDLVQRSLSGDHWKQFMRMRDNCVQSIFLIENDTRSATRFTAFGAQEVEGWDPLRTLIDDERSIFLFFGRALLSSPSANFIQTRDETSSLRAVGAVGLMAASSQKLRLKAAKAAPPERNSERKLVDRLTAVGVPWKLSRHIGDVIGSVRHLENLYKGCSSDACRSALLAPFITEESEYNGQKKSSAGWSDVIFRAYQSSSAFAATRVSSSSHTLPRRLVTIEISEDKGNLFPTPTETSFYAWKLSVENPLGLVVPTVVMRTTAGKLASHRLFVHLLQATSMVARITTNMQACAGDFVALAKNVANLINRECHHRTMVSGKDRRVLLLCGLTPALDSAAKKAGYRTETRAVADLVVAQLMLEHDLIVIQAVRLKGDTELILQLLALACYHFHLLFQECDGHHA